MKSPQTKKIAVLINPEDPHLAGYLRGIRDFSDQLSEWQLFGINLPCYQQIPNAANWQSDGTIISSDMSPTSHGLTPTPGKPSVSLGKSVHPISSVSIDLPQSFTTALAHFAEQGIRQIVTIGPHSKENLSIICSKSQHLDLACIHLELEEVLSFLSRQLGPVGVLTSDCSHSLQLAQLASKNGINIPADLAILSLGDDRNCRLASPGISSLPYPSRKIGYHAAEILHTQLRQPSDTIPTSKFIPQSSVNTRSSSLRTFTSDPLIQKAMRHIHLTAHNSPLKVGDLAQALKVSRANLSDHFQKFLRQSPTEIIRRERVSAAMRLLTQPDAMVKSVAISMGFSSSQEFARFFKNSTGQTPSQFAKLTIDKQTTPNLINSQQP